MTLLQRIRVREVKVAVVGMGYVGLPLAVEFAREGLKVAGFDINPEKLAMLRDGKSYIKDVPNSLIASLIASEHLIPTSNPRYINLSDVVVICVPTPCDKGNMPDLSFVEAAGKLVAGQLKRGHVVILESTSYPGTTEEVLQPLLETSGLIAGVDFYLAFSPERIDPGNANYNVRNTPKLVAGTNDAGTELAEAFYQLVADKVLRVSSPKAAEMTKLYENTFRHINIAFANEMALLCEKMGIDIWEVITAASSKPFGFMPFYPGPGVGGHCIPVDPQYLLHKAREYGYQLRFVELANEVNERMPQLVVDKVQTALNDRGKMLEGANLLVLGVAYKRDIEDCRESPALKVIENLMARGARVQYHDPHVESFEDGFGRFHSIDLDEDTVRNSDCVLICTDHSDLPYEMLAANSSLIVDTRNAIRQASSKNRRPADSSAKVTWGNDPDTEPDLVVIESS